jgi:hypothetical protein
MVTETYGVARFRVTLRVASGSILPTL